MNSTLVISQTDPSVDQMTLKVSEVLKQNLIWLSSKLIFWWLYVLNLINNVAPLDDLKKRD